jgi:hypothetical protein
MLLIGSQALKNLGFDCEPNDWDYIAWQERVDWFAHNKEHQIVLSKLTKHGEIFHVIGSKPIEFEIAEKRPSAKMLLEMNRPVDLDLLYTLKMSHRYLKNSPHFVKTRNDILMMRERGAKIPGDLKDWYKLRQEETYDYSHPVLNQKKNDFFKDDFYVYDHDTLHLAVMLYDKPAYDYIKVNTADVFCSKEKFMSAPYRIQIATVYEESCVLALERHQIPNEFRPDPRKSFTMALQKVCTSISSGWWRSFAWDSYDAALAVLDANPNYVEKFHKALKDGVVKYDSRYKKSQI